MSINKRLPKNLKNGFTIVELLIIAPIVILVIGTFIAVIVNMTGEVLTTRGANALAYNIQDSLNRIEADVKLSTTFLSTNNISPLTSPQGYDDGTASFTNVGANGNMLILNTLATTGNPLSSTSGVVYLQNMPNSCGSTQYNQNTPMTMNVVYFVKNNTLWRRTLTPANYLTAGCATPWQQPSCNPAITGAFCKTQDERLIDGINPSDFNIQYYNNASATSADSVASDSSQNDATRFAALQADTTVVASINMNQTIAGRSVSQSGSIRATKLDSIASTIAVVAPITTVPAAPSVTATLSVPDQYIFSWGRVANADTYTINYSIAGGTYVAGATNQNITSYTISAQRGQSICVTVYANNSVGSSPYGSSCATIPDWYNLTYQNGWSDYGGGYATGAYTKTSAGVVVLKGLVKRTGTPTAGETIAVLPVGYRPSEMIMFGTSTSTSGADATARIDIYPTGAIVYNTGSGGWLSLDRMMFIPSGSSYTWSLLSPINGWVNYGGGWATAGYTRDSAGHTFIKGLVGNGTTTDGTPIITIPTSYTSDQYLHVASTSNNTFDDIGVDTSGNIVPKGNALNAYKSLQISFLSPGYATWNALTLQSGWIAYPGFATPSYAKTADGMVSVKGLMYGGNTTAGLIIANLPTGYRPKEMHIFEEACANTYCRVDVWPNGNIIQNGGMQSGWSSLDSISFMAEQ